MTRDIVTAKLGLKTPPRAGERRSGLRLTSYFLVKGLLQSWVGRKKPKKLGTIGLFAHTHAVPSTCLFSKQGVMIAFDNRRAV